MCVVLHKYGRQIDQYIPRANQNVAVDGPVGD